MPRPASVRVVIDDDNQGESPDVSIEANGFFHVVSNHCQMIDSARLHIASRQLERLSVDYSIGPV